MHEQNRPICAAILVTLLLLLPYNRAAGQRTEPTTAQSLFHQGYYLQHQQLDSAGALALYERALAAEPDAQTLKNIRQQILAIKADIAASDFARLMPATSLAYLEVTDPARHLEKLLTILGIAGSSKSTVAETTIPLDEGFVLPSNFKIDPDVLNCFKSAKGLAVAVTQINPRGEPEFLLAVHPGSGNPIGGLLKTALQVVPKTEKVGGYPTYCHPHDIWLVETPTLILISPSTQLLTNAIARITEPEDSLASLGSFKSAREARGDAFAFAFVDGANLVKTASPHLQGEAAAARVVLDLDHLKCATAALHATETGVEAAISVAFTEDHHSLAYSLIRTAPLSGTSLGLVPNEALFVATLGINPRMANAAAIAAPHGFSILDLGRELFANIEEVSLFVLPQMIAAANKPAPEVGLIVASSNPQQSENLWRQLLSLPAKVDPRQESKVTEFTMHGRPAWRFRFPEKDAPEITLTRLSEHAMIVGTAQAVESMVSGTPSEASGGVFAGRSKDLPAHVSKAVFVNVGQALRFAGQVAPPAERDQILRISGLCQSTSVTLTSDEAPATWSLRLNAVGLPQIPDVVTAVAETLRQPQRNASTAPPSSDRKL